MTNDLRLSKTLYFKIVLNPFKMFLKECITILILHVLIIKWLGTLMLNVTLKN